MGAEHKEHETDPTLKPDDAGPVADDVLDAVSGGKQFQHSVEFLEDNTNITFC